MPVDVPIPEQAAIDRELIRRRGLHEFIRRAWGEVEPGPFVDSWHIGALAEALTACYLRQIRYLVINIPPGCMKSLSVGVMYPAWVWTLADHGTSPALAHLGAGAREKFIYATYEQSLAERDGKRHRDLVMSAWYQARWGHRCQISFASSRKVKFFETNSKGFRFSTSVGGGVTGRHSNQQIFDDPIKPKDVLGGAEVTRKLLDKANDFWEKTMPTRMSDPDTNVRIVMMQRLHDADTAGKAIASGQAVHLMLPMRYEPRRRCQIQLPEGVVIGDIREKDGELLWPERFSEETTQALEVSLGDQAAAQLQQDPVPSAGGIFKGDWFVRFWTYDGLVNGGPPPEGQIVVKLPDRRQFGVSTFSWDCAFKDTKASDWVVGQAWARSRGDYFLLAQRRDRLSYPETKDSVKAFALDFPWIVRKLIEDKANGTAVLADLQHDVPGLEPVEPEGGKVVRAHAVSHIFRSGNVYLPHPSIAPWVVGYIQEMTRFPRAPHDDQVDATSQALSALYTQGSKLAEAMAVVQADCNGRP